MANPLSAKFIAKPLQQIEQRFQNLSPFQKKALVSSAVLVVAAAALDVLMAYSINAATKKLNEQKVLYTKAINGEVKDYVKAGSSQWEKDASRTSPVAPFTRPEVLDFLPILFSRVALRHYSKAKESFELQQTYFDIAERRINNAWEALKCISTFQAAQEACGVKVSAVLGLNLEARRGISPENKAGIIANSFKIFTYATNFIEAIETYEGSLSVDSSPEKVMERLRELSPDFPKAKDLLNNAASACELLSKLTVQDLNSLEEEGALNNKRLLEQMFSKLPHSEDIDIEVLPIPPQPLVENATSKREDDTEASALEDEHKTSDDITTSSSPVVQLTVPAEASITLPQKAQAFLVNKASTFNVSSPAQAFDQANPVIGALKEALTKSPLDMNSPEVACLQYIIKLQLAGEFEAALENFFEQHVKGWTIADNESINYEQIAKALYWLQSYAATPDEAAELTEEQMLLNAHVMIVTQHRSETFEKLLPGLIPYRDPLPEVTIPKGLTLTSGEEYTAENLEADAAAILDKLKKLSLDSSFSDDESLGEHEESFELDEATAHDEGNAIQLVPTRSAGLAERLSIESIRSVNPSLLEGIEEQNESDLLKSIEGLIIQVIQAKNISNINLTAINRAIFSQTSDISLDYLPPSEGLAAPMPSLILRSPFPLQMGGEIKGLLFNLLLRQPITNFSSFLTDPNDRFASLNLDQLDPTAMSDLDLNDLEESIKNCFTEVLTHRLEL